MCTRWFALSQFGHLTMLEFETNINHNSNIVQKVVVDWSQLGWWYYLCFVKKPRVARGSWQLPAQIRLGIRHFFWALWSQSSEGPPNESILNPFIVGDWCYSWIVSIPHIYSLGSWHWNSSICPELFGRSLVFLFVLIGCNTPLIPFAHLLLQWIDPWPHSK